MASAPPGIARTAAKAALGSSSSSALRNRGWRCADAAPKPEGANQSGKRCAWEESEKWFRDEWLREHPGRTAAEYRRLVKDDARECTRRGRAAGMGSATIRARNSPSICSAGNETIDLNAPGGVRDYVNRYEDCIKRWRSRSRSDCYAEVKDFDAGGRLLKLRGCLGGIARVALGESAGAFLRSAALSQPLSAKRTGGLG